MRYDLNGRAILVTGGGSGIGRATAELCAAGGAHVVVAGLEADPIEEAVAAIRDTGGLASAFVVDVTDGEQVAASVAFTVETFGRLDGAFNAAGLSGPMFVPLLDLPEESFDEVLAVNVKGVWLSMKHQVAQMVAQGGGGSIVNASSVAGLVGTRVNTAYVASKHGVTGMTRSVAQEYARKGIRVNAVCPGWTETPMTATLAVESPRVHEAILAHQPMGRVGQPAETAALVAWLLSDEASFVTGAAIPVDGGFCA